jgi:acyl carrier protein
MSVHDDTQAFTAILREHLPAGAREGEIPLEAPLRDLGLNSMRAVDLLIGLEDQFGVTFPDEALTDETFATGAALLGVLLTLRGAVAHD